MKNSAVAFGFVERGTVHPDWTEPGLLDDGPQDLDKISPGLTRKFLSQDPETHLTDLEALAMPFRFNVFAAATPITRDEFIADQILHAQKLRQAILAEDRISVFPGLDSVNAPIDGDMVLVETIGRRWHTCREEQSKF
jgi:hypothetical protein